MNAVEREPVETRVLNPNASEASYKPKQRSYRKTKLIFFWGGFWSGGFYPGTVKTCLHQRYADPIDVSEKDADFLFTNKCYHTYPG